MTLCGRVLLCRVLAWTRSFATVGGGRYNTASAKCVYVLLLLRVLVGALRVWPAEQLSFDALMTLCGCLRGRAVPRPSAAATTTQPVPRASTFCCGCVARVASGACLDYLGDTLRLSLIVWVLVWTRSYATVGGGQSNTARAT